MRTLTTCQLYTDRSHCSQLQSKSVRLLLRRRRHKPIRMPLLDVSTWLGKALWTSCPQLGMLDARQSEFRRRMTQKTADSRSCDQDSATDYSVQSLPDRHRPCLAICLLVCLLARGSREQPLCPLSLDRLLSPNYNHHPVVWLG